MMKGGKGCGAACVAKWLVIIGGLNWGLVGAFDFNLVNAILGSMSWLERLVYVLVGLSALVMLAGCFCKKCKSGKNGGCCSPKGGSCKGGSCSGK